MNKPRGRARKIAGSYALSFVVWLLLGLMFALQQYRNSLNAGGSVSFLDGARLPVVHYLVYAILTPPLFWFTRKIGFDLHRWWRAAGAHFAGAACFAVAHATIRLAVLPAHRFKTGEVVPFSAMGVAEMAKALAFDYVWMYATIAGFAYATDYYTRLRERELSEAKLQARVAGFELQALRMQLHPHFLFNTLHAISTLMGKNVPAARTMIVRLSDLLRVAMEDVFVTEVPLRKELRFLEAYLGIEQLRLGARLKIEWRIDDEALDARTPGLLLQPLVENAIKHGIDAQLEPGVVAIEARKCGNELLLRVVNDGPVDHSRGSLTSGSGIGLGNTCARLQHLYGDEQQVSLRERDTGGAEVTIRLPFRPVRDHEGVAR